MSEVHGPWEQAENSDYDEQKPSSADSHEDEFDEEYGEQQPHGDPNRPDTSGWDRQYGGQIDYWEEVARLNEIARPFDPAARDAAEATAHDPDDFDRAETVVDVGPQPIPRSAVTEPEPAGGLAADDSYKAVVVDPAGPPTPDSTVTEPAAAADLSFDPAVPLADSFEADDAYQPAIVDPGVEFSPDTTQQPDWNDFIG